MVDVVEPASSAATSRPGGSGMSASIARTVPARSAGLTALDGSASSHSTTAALRSSASSARKAVGLAASPRACTVDGPSDETAT